jgi:hypothetical protein
MTYRIAHRSCNSTYKGRELAFERLRIAVIAICAIGQIRTVLVVVQLARNRSLRKRKGVVPAARIGFDSDDKSDLAAAAAPIRCFGASAKMMKLR